MSKTEKTTRTAAWTLGELFTLYSVIHFGLAREWERLLLSAVTLALLCLPLFLEKLLDCRLALPLYLFSLFYALGSMLGHSYKLYYILPWWDSMLHLFGGIAFAVVGYYMLQWMGLHGKSEQVAYAVFAMCFSMALALLWEFFEYGMDRVFDMDMQNDTVVRSINSYHLGSEMGVLGRIPSIESVVINGAPLPTGGYLDLGLIDTMTDTLLESIGSAVTVALLALDKGRHPLFVKNGGKDAPEAA